MGRLTRFTDSVEEILLFYGNETVTRLSYLFVPTYGKHGAFKVQEVVMAMSERERQKKGFRGDA